MTERPILFSAPMVRALLAGRKTQTRRMIKFIPALGTPEEWCSKRDSATFAKIVGDYRNFCPHGRKDDRLWVKETFCYDNEKYVAEYKKNPWMGMPSSGAAETYYRASEANPAIFPRWRPSIFMPRWASRITLKIVEVRAQRLQDISESDARAEGIFSRQIPHAGFVHFAGVGETDGYLNARDAYRALWESINGAGSWNKNSWVWAITFKLVSS